MKKFLVSIFSIVLAAALMLFSVGCSNEIYLSFNNNFNGGGEAGEPNTAYSETLTYEVNFSENYRDNLIVKDDDITDEVIKYRFENGSYVQNLEVLSFLPESISTDIDVTSSKIYHLSSMFKITAIYDLNDDKGEQTFEDSIETDAYFLPAGQSFAPIYAKVKTTNTLVSLTNSYTAAALEQRTSESVTAYNTEKYTVNQTIGDQSKTNEYKYDYKTLIDNTAFLFAIRGLTINEESSADIPVVSPAYGEAKTLRITNGGALSTKVNAVIDGVAVDETVAVTNLTYQLNTVRNSGAPQYVLVQSAKSENVPFKAFPVEYAQTLTTYGTFTNMGALVYTLKTATITNG